MIYVSNYNSPIGILLIASKDDKIIGLWIENQKYYLKSIKEEYKVNDSIPIIIKTKEYLERYFKKEKPSIKELEPFLAPNGSSFQKRIWKILLTIPYGSVVTYKEIAKRAENLANENKTSKVSAQAVGGAVARNPISIIIPCHRVIGSNGSLTGYAGGLEKKAYLLEHENVIH